MKFSEAMEHNMHKILITLSFISVLSLSACKDEQVNNQDVPKK